MATLDQVLKTGRFGMTKNNYFFVVIGDSIVYEDGGYDTIHGILSYPCNDRRSVKIIFSDNTYSFNQAHIHYEKFEYCEWINPEEDLKQLEKDVSGELSHKPSIDYDQFVKCWESLQNYHHFIDTIFDISYEYASSKGDYDGTISLPSNIINDTLSLLFLLIDTSVYSKDVLYDLFYNDYTAENVWNILINHLQYNHYNEDNKDAEE